MRLTLLLVSSVFLVFFILGSSLFALAAFPEELFKAFGGLLVVISLALEEGAAVSNARLLVLK